MKVLFLSNGTTLGSTVRILQYWLELGNRDGLRGYLVGRPGCQIVEWGNSRGVKSLIDSMPWPNRRAPWTALWHAMRVARWGKRVGIDVIHCNEHDVYPFAMVLKRFLNRPVVCHVRYRLDRGFAQWAFNGHRAPDALLWTSLQQKSDSASAMAGLVPEGRQHVVRLGVNVDEINKYVPDGRQLRASLGIRDDEIVIGMPSPLRPRKRVEDFIAIFRQLGPRYPNVVGLIAGQEVPGHEAYREQIEREIEASQLGRRLRWIGYLNPIEPFHHACDISVSTSEYETFGNSVCEAMACGKPVAAYHGGSVAEVIGGAGLIVETGNIDGLATAIETLLSNEPLRHELGALARQRVAEEFCPAMSFRQVKEIYSQLVRA